MSIATAVLDALSAEAARHPAERPAQAGRRIGEFQSMTMGER